MSEPVWKEWYDGQPIKPFPYHTGHKCFMAGVDAANLAWKNRLVPLLKELQDAEYLSEQQCAELCGTDILWWRFFRDEAVCGNDAETDAEKPKEKPLKSTA